VANPEDSASERPKEDNMRSMRSNELCEAEKQARLLVDTIKPVLAKALKDAPNDRIGAMAVVATSGYIAAIADSLSVDAGLDADLWRDCYAKGHEIMSNTLPDNVVAFEP
jgi:hypothetical protein